jgi:hypothetical protein
MLKISITKKKLCKALSSNLNKNTGRHHLIFNIKNKKITKEFASYNPRVDGKIYIHNVEQDDYLLYLSNMNWFRTDVIRQAFPSLDYDYLLKNLDFDLVAKDFSKNNDKYNIEII